MKTNPAEKFNFSYVVGSLNNYTNELNAELVKQMIGKARTLDFISIRTNIKQAEAINIANTTINPVAGGACSFADAGSSTFTQVNLAVTPLQHAEQLCSETLEQKWVGMYMKPGSYNEDIPFAEFWIGEKTEKIGRFVDQLMWQGNTSLTAGTITFTGQNLSNGFVKYCTGLTGAVSVTTATGFTAGSIIATVDSLIDAIPADVRDVEDLTLFCSRQIFDTYTRAIRNANLFHYNPEDLKSGVAGIPGTNVTMVATVGLSTPASTSVILTPASNLYFGTDLVSDYATIDTWYSKDNQAARLICKWKQGVAVAFPQYIVKNFA